MEIKLIMEIKIRVKHWVKNIYGIRNNYYVQVDELHWNGGNIYSVWFLSYVIKYCTFFTLILS